MSPSLSECFFHNNGLFLFLYLISCGKVTEVSELIYDFALQLPKRYIHQCTYTTGVRIMTVWALQWIVDGHSA